MNTMRHKKQLIEKVIEILEDESENFKYRRIATKDCARRLLSIFEYEEQLKTINPFQEKIDKALVHLQRGSELDVLEAIRILK